MKKILAPDKKYPASFLTYLTILVLIMVIAGIIACSKSKNPSYKIVQVTGDAQLNNLSKSGSYNIYADSAISSAMLIEDGDLIEMGLLFIDCFQESKTDGYHIKDNDSLLFINNQLSCIMISDRFEMTTILKQLRDDEIKGLRSLTFFDTISDNYLPLIEKIASKNNHMGLYLLPENNKLTTSIISKFDPAWIALPIISKEDLKVLGNLKNIKALRIIGIDSAITEPLPKMPQLKQLILDDMNIKDEIAADFLVNNRQIERVVLDAEDPSSLSIIQPLKKVKSLSLYADSSELNLEQRNLRQLEVLNVNSEKVENIESINNLPELKWLTLPGSITQDEFNSIIHAHKHLEVLEILECKNITSLKPLTKLSKLNGLVITDQLCDKETLKLLNQLKYLSIPTIVYNDSTYMASLHESIPAMVVPNEGICLGSGWLLLLFPLILLFVIIRKRR